jgi:hypothetical protein
LFDARREIMTRLLIPITLMVAALLLPLPREWSVGWRGELLNRLHAPLFAAFGMLMPFRKTWMTLGIVIAAAAVAEIVQPWFGRSASLTDLGWGALGAVAATLWQRGRIAFRLVALSMSLAPPGIWWAQVAKAQNEAERQFPLLMGGHATLLWVLSPGAERSENGLILHRGSSIRVEVPYPDWNAFQALELEGTLESAGPLELGIRLDIDAGLPNRVQAGVTFQPGSNRVLVPWPENARLSPVKKLVLFLGSAGPEARLRLNEARLLPVTKN